MSEKNRTTPVTVNWHELHGRAREGIPIHDAMADKWLDLLQALVEKRITTQQFNDQWLDYLRSLCPSS